MPRARCKITFSFAHAKAAARALTQAVANATAELYKSERNAVAGEMGRLHARCRRHRQGVRRAPAIQDDDVVLLPLPGPVLESSASSPQPSPPPAPLAALAWTGTNHS